MPNRLIFINCTVDGDKYLAFLFVDIPIIHSKNIRDNMLRQIIPTLANSYYAHKQRQRRNNTYTYYQYTGGGYSNYSTTNTYYSNYGSTTGTTGSW